MFPGLVYLEGQGDLATGLIMGITGVTAWVLGVIKLLGNEAIQEKMRATASLGFI